MRFGWFPRQASGDIVLVAIDSPIDRQIGVWPWPRRQPRRPDRQAASRRRERHRVRRRLQLAVGPRLRSGVCRRAAKGRRLGGAAGVQATGGERRGRQDGPRQPAAAAVRQERLVGDRQRRASSRTAWCGAIRSARRWTASSCRRSARCWPASTRATRRRCASISASARRRCRWCPMSMCCAAIPLPSPSSRTRRSSSARPRSSSATVSACRTAGVIPGPAAADAGGGIDPARPRAAHRLASGHAGRACA